MIKANEIYSVNGVYLVSQRAVEAIQNSEPFLMYLPTGQAPLQVHHTTPNSPKPWYRVW